MTKRSVTFRTGSGNGVAERPARGSVSVAGRRGAADADEASSTNLGTHDQAKRT